MYLMREVVDFQHTWHFILMLESRGLLDTYDEKLLFHNA